MSFSMKNVIIIAILLAAPIWCIGQTIKSAKMYSYFALYGGISIPYFESNSNEVLAFRWFSPAIRFQHDNGRYKELELTNLIIERAPDIETDTRFSFGFRYEFGKRFTKNADAKLSFAGGLSLRPYFGLIQLNALNPLGIEAENTVLGSSMAILPHLEYRIHRNLIFDFSPICEVANIAVRSEYVYDQFIDEEQRQSLDFYFKSFQLFLRIGVAWEFK
jgi:hypothetical protein